MDQPSLTAISRTSAIPRPQSKLPIPNPSQIARPASPPSQQPASKKQSAFPAPSKPVHRTNSSVASSHSSGAHSLSRESHFTSPQKRPLKPSSRPQSRQDSAVGQLPFEHDVVAARPKGHRHPSQQENACDLPDSPDGSDIPARSLEQTDRSSKRVPRPSLSDRTVDSLSSIPPSPAVDRRRSSFFNAQSPMTTPRPTSRPASAIGPGTVPKLKLDNGVARPQSPPKRVGHSGVPVSPAKRTVSSTLPKTPTAMPLPHKRTESTPKAISTRFDSQVPSKAGARTTALGRSAVSKPSRPSSMISPTKSSNQYSVSQPGLESITCTPKIKHTAPLVKPDPQSKDVDNGSVTPTHSPKTSAALRAQIAAAKVAHRNTHSQESKEPSSTHHLKNFEDPFNQAVSSQTDLARRVDAARRDGRLNISALDLQEVPVEVLTMYDAKAMEESSVPWNETVDLVRLNAADNLIDDLGESTFPDVLSDNTADVQDARGNQFGGLEALDLHGNALRTIPMGLRRLERLTTLNLSRNRIDNTVFEVIEHMPSLREIRLSENELVREVPGSIGQLPNLELLDLSKNRLSNLPGCVRDLVGLRVLNLSSNRFAELPIGSIFSLPVLQELTVASNALTGAFFPMTVDIVRSLQRLDVSDNSLASISFGTELHLPSVEHVDVARNRLCALPNVSSWKNLITLLAAENGLTAFPDGLTSLKKLKMADFERNSLRTLEPEIANMEALQHLCIAANPLRDRKFLSMNTEDSKEAMARRLLAAPT